jgi:WD40 repeat protein
MDHRTRSLSRGCATALVFAGLTLAACAEDYASWMATHAKQELSGRGGSSTLKLAITKFTEPKPGARPDPFTSEASEGIEITVDGRVHMFRRHSMGEQGGGGEQLPAATLARLDALLAALPEDGQRLPPPRRRVLIQAKLGDRLVTRLYDRAQAPDAAWEAMRICNCNIGLVVPDLKPQSVIDAHGRSVGGFLRLTPEGKQLLFAGADYTLQLWDPISHEFLNELRGLGSWGIAFSPDGAYAVMGAYNGSAILDTRTWKRTPQQFNCGQGYFTRDGRHLIQDGRSGNFHYPLKIYETATWRPVAHLPEIPANALCFRPAPKRALAIVQSEAGAVSLWNTEAHREIAVLRSAAEVIEIAFSPDETLVAVSTLQDQSGFHAGYGIWRTADGAKFHELHPFERGSREPSKGLVWTSEGAYLLAGVCPDWGSTNSVCLFNVTTGHQEAEFSGPRRINGLVLLPDATQLIAGDSDGKIHFWDFQDALRKAREFQQSLPAR